MRVGWYQRYQEYYAQARKEGYSHEDAREWAISLLKEEGK